MTDTTEQKNYCSQTQRLMDCEDNLSVLAVELAQHQIDYREALDRLKSVEDKPDPDYQQWYEAHRDCQQKLETMKRYFSDAKIRLTITF